MSPYSGLPLLQQAFNFHLGKMFRMFNQTFKFTRSKKYYRFLYSVFLVSICVGSFYINFGLGPFSENNSVFLDQSNILQVDFITNGPEHRFWPESEKCSHFVTRFSKINSLPTRALASYPGSGNTWIRYLIEGGTGIYTGSIFKDRDIDKAGHHGELKKFDNGATILQKTHHRSIFSDKMAKYQITWRQRHISSFESRGVVVVRNPYEAILSYWNFYNTQNHTDTVNQATYRSSEFNEFLVVGAARWFEVISDWIQFGSQVYFIFYEEIKQDPISELKKLMDYLIIPVDENRLKCIKEHSTGSFHRTQHETVNPFSGDQHIILRSVIDKAENLMQQFNGRKLPTQKYKYYNDYNK